MENALGTVPAPIAIDQAAASASDAPRDPDGSADADDPESTGFNQEYITSPRARILKDLLLPENREHADAIASRLDFFQAKMSKCLKANQSVFYGMLNYVCHYCEALIVVSQIWCADSCCYCRRPVPRRNTTAAL